MGEPTALTISRVLEELDALEDGSDASTTHIRIGLADGVTLEGYLFSVRPTELTVVNDATAGFTRVVASDIRTLAVQTPRRGREWAVAVLSIIGATIALAGYATLPWVRPRHEGQLMIGFMLLCAIVLPIVSLLRTRTRVGAWFTQWKPLYPPSVD